MTDDTKRKPSNLNFHDNGRVSVDVNSLLRSPRVQAQVSAVRDFFESDPGTFTRDPASVPGTFDAGPVQASTAPVPPSPTDVRRFSCHTQEDGVYESRTGEHVAYADYANLAIDLRRERERSSAMAKELRDISIALQDPAENNVRTSVECVLALRERAECAEGEARLWLSEYNRLRQEIADATARCVAHLAERDALRADALGRICEHGQLARSCDHCDNAREIAELHATVERQALEIAELRAMLQTAIQANGRLAELADKYKWQVRDTCTRAERAEAERDALRADAERYRWLRAAQSQTARNWIVINNRNMYGEHELDAAIDAARKV